MSIFVLVLKIIAIYILLVLAGNITYFYLLGGKKKYEKMIERKYGKGDNEDADIDPRWEMKIK